jgi:hypothetical protein
LPFTGVVYERPLEPEDERQNGRQPQRPYLADERPTNHS